VSALALVARRDIWRHRLRSALVVSLIALPVAAMVAGIVLYRTTTPSDERSTTAQMGRADLMASNATRADLERYLPAGSRVVFTFYWTEEKRWEGTNFEVCVE